MKKYPPIPRVEDAPDELFESGHLWLLEKIDGAILRFQLRESGMIRFGDRNRVYDDPESIPESYHHAVRHVRERLDRDAIRSAVDDVESVVFFGEATHRHSIEYDWDRLPSFLGFDVWSAEREAFRPPGATQGIFERVGLEAVNDFDRELNTRDFDPASYTIPESAWYDGPAAGVIIKNKRGGRAQVCHPNVEAAEEPPAIDTSAEELAERYATEPRLEKNREGLQAREKPISFENLFKETFTDIVRENHRQLYGDASSVDPSAFRSAVASRTQAFLTSNGE